MKDNFKDLFSHASQQYSAYRPHYPQAFFSYLYSMSMQHQTAWDCATGNGQAAVKLADYFSQVIATDASQKQIDNAQSKKGVLYRVATAEHSSITTNSIDLITVAQALHWFNIEKFSSEVNRVLKSDGILAVWTYNLLSIQDNIDTVINHLYHTILADCWTEERKIVENNYQSIQFPLQEVTTNKFAMTSLWNLTQLTGYLNTWSAVNCYQKKHTINPVKLVYPELLALWGKPENTREVTWPLSIRLWKK